MIKTILWLIVFAFIGTIFYSWGAGGRVGGRSGVVATVDGTNINLSDYDQSYNNLVNFYRDQFKGQFSQELVEKLDLKNTALDALIQKSLLLREAEKQNIEISDKQLLERIKSIPSFQKDNVFSKSLYDNYLSFSHQTPREFEEKQRESMLMEKVEESIKGNVQVSDAEMREAFKKENDKVKFSYIQISKKQFKPEAAPSDEEIKNYFEKNKTKFEVPEQIKVQYVKLTPESLKEDIVIHDEDIQDYYNANMAKYLIEKRYRARHLLIRATPELPDGEATEEAKKKALDEAEQKAKTKIEGILKKIQEGEDFAKMAKEHSEDPGSGKNGGDLGQFAKGTMVPEFEKALDTLKPGEVGGPVKTVFGYHLIRLDEVLEEREKPLEEVKDEIAKQLKTKKGQQRVRRTIKKIFQSSDKDSDLARAAKEYNAETKTTDFISSKTHNVPDIGIVPEFFNTAFILKDGVIGNPVHTAEASFLMKVVERKAPYFPDLETVLSDVTRELSTHRTEKYTEEKFKSLEKRLKQESGLDKLATELKMEIQDTPFFSMADTIPGIGNIQPIKEKVFTLKPGDLTTGSSRHSYYLIKVLERENAKAPTDAQSKEIISVLKKEKGNQVFKEWMDKTKEEAEIMIDTTLL